MKYKYILWDWNGTLLDDLDASLFAVNDMLEMYGKPPLDLDTYYSYIDTPIYKFYEKIFDLNVVTMEIIKPLFGEFYIKHEDKITLADGAEQAIEKCCQAGIKQYILSAAHIDDLSRHAKKLGVYDRFDKIEAATDYEAGSKIDRAKKLMLNENIVASECVMVGDTLHDFETANALGVECILYSKGHTDYETLKNTGKQVCSSFEKIVKLILK